MIIQKMLSNLTFPPNNVWLLQSSILHLKLAIIEPLIVKFCYFVSQREQQTKNVFVWYNQFSVCMTIMVLNRFSAVAGVKMCARRFCDLIRNFIFITTVNVSIVVVYFDSTKHVDSCDNRSWLPVVYTVGILFPKAEPLVSKNLDGSHWKQSLHSSEQESKKLILFVWFCVFSFVFSRKKNENSGQRPCPQLGLLICGHFLSVLTWMIKSP